MTLDLIVKELREEADYQKSVHGATGVRFLRWAEELADLSLALQADAADAAKQGLQVLADKTGMEATGKIGPSMSEEREWKAEPHCVWCGATGYGHECPPCEQKHEGEPFPNEARLKVGDGQSDKDEASPRKVA